MVVKEKKSMNREKSGFSVLRWISSVTEKAKYYIAILIILQMCLGAGGIFSAILMRELVNAAVDGSFSGFFRAALWFSGIVLIQILHRAAARFFDEYAKATIENRFKYRLFMTILNKDYAKVTRLHSGEWLNRMTSDTLVVAEGVTHILPGLAGMIVKMLGALAAILWLEPFFLWILIPAGVLLIFFTYAFRKILKQLHRKIQESDGRLRVFLSENLGSLMIVRIFAKEHQALKQAQSLMNAHKQDRMRRNGFSIFCNIGFASAMNGVYVLGAVFCGYGILNGTMSYGNFMAILQLVAQVQSPFASITGYLPQYYAMLASAERLMQAEFLENNQLEAIDQKDIQAFYQERFEGIELERASFAYQPMEGSEGEECADTMVVSDFNLAIQKGEYLAFTGPSGCGKSTLLKLLMCLYPLNAGERCLLTKEGKVELTNAWRGLFAYVPQGHHLMTGTIREIVAFGDEEKMRDEESLQGALKTACADGFVRALEHGVDTPLGEHGAGLSEGQMQRIAIARAVFSEHPILILDEATSSLDARTEQKLLNNLRSMTDKTVLIVTHRVAALEICDRQISLEQKGDK